MGDDYCRVQAKLCQFFAARLAIAELAHAGIFHGEAHVRVAQRRDLVLEQLAELGVTKEQAWEFVPEGWAW